jgi:hypothetical protein
MNLRDTFASIAMHGIMTCQFQRGAIGNDNPEAIAKQAYDLAAAMLNERASRPDPDELGEIAEEVQALTVQMSEVSEALQEVALQIEHLDSEKSASGKKN